MPGQADGEPAAPIRTIGRLDPTAMKLGNPLGDFQSQPRASPKSFFPLGLSKTIENMGDQIHR